MADAGILGEDDRVELLEGEIVEMAPIGSRHAGCVNDLNRLLVQGVGERAVVAVQNPVRLSRRSEPQPDVAVLRPREDRYRRAHPAPGDVLLLVEVADTTVGFDRRYKIPLYAIGGIAEVWLVDLPAATVEVHREPEGRRYADRRLAKSGEQVAPHALPDVLLSVADLVG